MEFPGCVCGPKSRKGSWPRSLHRGQRSPWGALVGASSATRWGQEQCEQTLGKLIAGQGWDPAWRNIIGGPTVAIGLGRAFGGRGPGQSWAARAGGSKANDLDLENLPDFCYLKVEKAAASGRSDLPSQKGVAAGYWGDAILHP